ncbi:hypothetical protein HELRODRAFT_164476 [Helobdella robusta]|uniref:Methyltransferase FkbM domain-containing protein n=1 Tax=Helobdella robusta TaxID=6412 RepID=T1EVH1_HELRO|nr:hypothetical protein HELRODRAFT_164476 [Helobdella robusta]ESN94611.1 hypothetical protein HELRODRAFT_164476 [Helobdella robusta]
MSIMTFISTKYAPTFKKALVLALIMIFLWHFLVLKNDLHQNITLNGVHIYKRNFTNEIKFNCVKTKTEPNFTICVHDPNVDVFISGSIINQGANIGYYTLLAAKMGFLVVAVEPMTAMVERLYASLEIENLLDRVVIIQNVLSNIRSTVYMSTTPNNQGDSRVYFNLSTNMMQSTQAAKSVYLDDISHIVINMSLSKNNLDVIMKMDVQGFEHRAFAFADKFFDQNNVKIIFMEWYVMAVKHPNYNKEILEKFMLLPDDYILVEKLVKFISDRGFKAYSAEQNTIGNLLNQSEWQTWTYNVLWCHHSVDLSKFL